MNIRAVFATAKEQRDITPRETVFAEGDRGRETFGLISGAVALRHGDQTVRVLADRIRELDALRQHGTVPRGTDHSGAR